MDEDEQRALLAQLRYYRELLSSTLDSAKISGYEYMIGRIEARLVAAGLPVPLECG